MSLMVGESDKLSPPYKVVYFVTTLSRGGTERNLVEYSKRLPALGFQTEVWFLYANKNDYSKDLQDCGVTTRCFNVTSRFGLNSILRVSRALANAEADLFHLYLPTVAYYYLLSRWFFGNRTPAIYSCGGTACHLPFEKRMTRLLGKVTFPVVGNSLAVLDFLEGCGIARERMRVIANGHDLERYDADFDRGKFRRENGLPDANSKILISVGRLIESKRHVDLINAFASLKTDFEKLHLVLVGDGAIKQALSQQVVDLGLSKHVSFLGVRTDVIDCLRAADYFVFPTESEGLPNALIEASLAGLPVVATDILPNQAVVSDGESALFVKTRCPDEIVVAMKKLLGSDTLAEQLSRCAREIAVKAYDIENSVSELKLAYLDALKGWDNYEPS